MRAGIATPSAARDGDRSSRLRFKALEAETGMFPPLGNGAISPLPVKFPNGTVWGFPGAAAEVTKP